MSGRAVWSLPACHVSSAGTVSPARQGDIAVTRRAEQGLQAPHLILSQEVGPALSQRYPCANCALTVQFVRFNRGTEGTKRSQKSSRISALGDAANRTPSQPPKFAAGGRDVPPSASAPRTLRDAVPARPGVAFTCPASSQWAESRRRVGLVPPLCRRPGTGALHTPPRAQLPLGPPVSFPRAVPGRSNPRPLSERTTT